MPHREMTNRQVVYTAPPVDADFQPEASFDLTETTITDKIAAGEVLVRNRLLSVDPYHRFGLYDPATAESQFPATGGGVGSTAAQVAKHRGLRVVGTAGSADKADELREHFALDEVINHRAGSLEESIRLACPDGIDIYLDLVGGAMLDAALANLNQGARVPCAGMVSQYDLPANQRYRLANLERIVGMDITIQSYRNDTYSDLQAVIQASTASPAPSNKYSKETRPENASSTSDSLTEAHRAAHIQIPTQTSHWVPSDSVANETPSPRAEAEGAGNSSSCREVLQEAQGVAEWVGDPGRQSEFDVSDAVGGGEAVLVEFVDHDAFLSEFVEFGVEVGNAPEGLGLGVGGASRAQRQSELGAGGSDDEAMFVAFEDREPELLVVEAVGGIEVGNQ